MGQSFEQPCLLYAPIGDPLVHLALRLLSTEAGESTASMKHSNHSYTIILYTVSRDIPLEFPKPSLGAQAVRNVMAVL
ncbi:uncharacterized protein IAS62_002140 [Cryptococcus decagattii]|uniref:Uncharacterized protein n=1 Tax=Cryptococcus decagattii TaxID=1859122 RepID=A0ABZ2AQQ2_9TREE